MLGRPFFIPIPMLADLPLTALNRLLASEAWARKLLLPHAGRRALIELGGYPLRFTVGPDGQLLAATPGDSDTPDASIRIPFEALGRLADGPEALRSAARIEGHAGFAESLAMLFQHLRPDPAAWLAPWLGDILAQRLVSSAQQLGRTGVETGRRLGSAGLELLRQSDGPLPSRAEFQAFSSQLSALAERLDRLEKR